MREFNSQYSLQQARSRSKKPFHLNILTLDDLPRTNVKYSVLIAKLMARYRAAKEDGKDAPTPKPEDFST
jgi:hypothetical protein